MVIYFRCARQTMYNRIISLKHFFLCHMINIISSVYYIFLTVFTVFRLLTDFVCLYNYEFGLSLCKIVRSSVILLLPLLTMIGLIKKNILVKILIITELIFKEINLQTSVL